ALTVRLRTPASANPDIIKPDPAAASGFDVRPSDAGEIDWGLGLWPDEKMPELAKVPLDANEKMLRADHHLTVLDDTYGKRRLAGMASLNASDAVIPPSRFMLEVYEQMGLRAGVGRHVRLGLPHFDQIHRRAKLSPFYRVRPKTEDRPVRLAFFGTTRNNKGFAVLADAIEMLDVADRQRCHFLIRVAGNPWPFRKRLSRFPEVNLTGGYDPVLLYASAPEYDAAIMAHVWFENSPLVLLEHFHAGKFVIGPRLGGPVDWVIEPGTDAEHPLGNGLFFAGGDPAGLAAAISRVARGEVTLPSPEEIHRATTLVSYPEHVREVADLYADVCGIGGGATGEPSVSVVPGLMAATEVSKTS
ncbi:MAG: glycosyltransferase, partial [Planctomycetota bacterium]